MNHPPLNLEDGDWSMIVTVFRSRLRQGVEQELLQLGEQMYSLASAMPGFISYKDFMAEDGEIVTIVEFDSLDSLAAWKEHPEHLKAQQRGREEFFSEYHIQVCNPVRDYEFKDQVWKSNLD